MLKPAPTLKRNFKTNETKRYNKGKYYMIILENFMHLDNYNGKKSH